MLYLILYKKINTLLVLTFLTQPRFIFFTKN